MSKLFDYCTELGRKKSRRNNVEEYRKKEHHIKIRLCDKMLKDENIRICLLEGMPVEQKQAVKDYFEAG